MNCAEFKEVLHDLDRPGTPGLGLREDALAHAEACETCALAMIESESLDFGLHQLTLDDAEKQAPRAVETAVLTEFRKQRVVASTRVRWQVAALATAALLLLGLGVALRGRIEKQLNVARVTPVGTNSNATTAAANNANAESASDEGEDEYASNFVTLPFADDPDAVENGTVVRVVMSRSALASLGVPSVDAGNSDEIPADLVLSDDGTPQAIRLVSEAELD
jgi:hypothetical protein